MKQVVAGALLAMTAGIGLPAGTMAKDVNILASDLPPMMAKDGKGREAAIIGETLAACGHKAVFTVVPFSRNWADYKNDSAGTFDAVTPVPPGMSLPGVPSVVHIRFQNGASVLKSSGLAIQGVGDLGGQRIITFAGGKDILPGLKEAIGGFADFQEKADQLIHSSLLFAKRVDVVLGDGLIFAEYNRQLQDKVKAGDKLNVDPGQDVIFTAIFPPSPYTVVFRDPALRDDFNRCFDALTRKGRIDAINKDAVEPYRATVGTQYLGY